MKTPKNASPHAQTHNCTVLVTGAAGFIGFHVAQKLLARGDRVIGLDNVNDYYDVALKEARLKLLSEHTHFTFVRGDCADQSTVEKLFTDHAPTRVVHLAAQAGVRHSITHPRDYLNSNSTGFFNVIDAARQSACEHFVYASSSSVYGANTQMPFSTHHGVDHPLSLYAATKRANELTAHSYSHIYQLPTTGLRFFTVYGPWGRPDMALFLFTRAILNDEPIKLFNNGQMQRDFTFIDDIVEGVVRTLDHVAAANLDWNSARPDPSSSTAPYRIFNIGNNRPVELLTLVETLEAALGKQARKEFLPMQLGDVHATFADIEDLEKAVGFRPSTDLTTGIGRFVDWYRAFYGV